MNKKNNQYSYGWIIYTCLALKGIGGNVTPVALASLATIVPRRKFTLYLAIAICAYSLGWVPIYLRSFEATPLAASLLAIICTLLVIRWFRESEFDDFSFQNNKASLRKFFTFMRKDLVSIALFAVGVSALLAFCGFIASEVSFYQILLRGEVAQVNGFYSGLSYKFGISYYLGTFLLFLLQKRNFSDIRCLTIGIFLASLSIIVGAFLSFIGSANPFILNCLIGVFSIGFALFIPSLFSTLSKIRTSEDQGKIYGFLDTTDTFAAYLAIKYIGLSAKASYTSVLWFSTILILVGAVFIIGFIQDVKDREIKMR